MRIFSLLHIKVFLFALLLFLSLPLQAQDYMGVTSKAVNGIASISSSIISDSFVPMTHYDEGEWTGTFVPAYFKITRAYDDPKLKGSGLDGFALGFGGGYALTDRFMAYTIFSYMGIEGGIQPAEGNYQGLTVKTDYSLLNVNAGLGFDFLEGGKWSAPVFIGFGLQYFDVNLDFPVFSMVKAEAKGDGLIGSFNLGISASRMFFDYIKITPYYLFLVGFNRPVIGVSAGSLPAQSIKMDTVIAGMLGVAISFVPTKALSISLSVGGLLTSSSQFYNRLFLDGTEMFSLVVAVTYRGGIKPVVTVNDAASKKKKEYFREYY